MRPKRRCLRELGADYAQGIRQWFPGPVDLMGVATGGSVALQLAADHADVAEGDLRHAGVAMWRRESQRAAVSF